MPEIWQDIATGFSLSLIAYAATNVDNFLALVGVTAGGTRFRPISLGFAIATAFILVLATSFSVLSFFVSPQIVRYLGLVPIIIGIRMLARGDGVSDSAVCGQITASSVSVLLAANSMDTVATFGPLFAESESIVRLSMIVGYVVTATIMIWAVFHLSRGVDTVLGSGKAIQVLAPLVMIGVGCYVLLNTGTDLEL